MSGSAFSRRGSGTLNALRLPWYGSGLDAAVRRWAGSRCLERGGRHLRRRVRQRAKEGFLRDLSPVCVESDERWVG
jgi:hypothetical protein